MVKLSEKILSIVLERLFRTLAILILIRAGTFFPVPGINAMDLNLYIQTHSITKSFIITFSGDNSFVIGLFTFNILFFTISFFVGIYCSKVSLFRNGWLQWFSV